MTRSKTFFYLIPLLSLSSFPIYSQAEPDAAVVGTNNRAIHLREISNRLLQIRAEAETGTASNLSNLLKNDAAAAIQARAAAFRDLADADPVAAVSFAFSPELTADLASKFPDAAPGLEVQGSWQGQVERWVADDAQRQTSNEVLRLRTALDTLEVRIAGRNLPALNSGQSVELAGVRIGSILLANAVTLSFSAPASASASNIATTSIQPELQSNPTASSTAAPACTTTGPQKTAILLATWSGITPPSTITPQSVHDTFFGTGHSLDGYWREASYGTTSATGDVFGWYTLKNAYTCSTMDQARDEAIQMAVAAGANFQNYTRIFVIYPNIGCVSGFAQVGCSSLATPSGTVNASSAYIEADYMGGDQGVYFAIHEGGHNLGLQHAGTLSYAGEPLGSLTSSGTVNEFGDNFSAMGSETLGQYSAQHKAEVLGWLSSGVNYQVIQSGSSWTLRPFETTTAGMQALKIQRGTGNNSWLWLEYRQPTGVYDSTLYFQQPSGGAFIHYEDSTTGVYTHLLNFQPQTASWYAPAMVAGQTWVDPYTNLTVSVPSASSSAMTVNVSYGAVPCTRINPTISVSPTNPSTTPGKSVSYTVTVTNNDSAGCTGSTFSMGSSQPTGWQTAFSTTSLTIAPGQIGTTTLTKTVPSSTTTGVYAVDSTAANSLDSGSGSANVTVTTPSLSVLVSTPSSTYTRGQTLPLSAMVSYSGSAASASSVTFTLTDPKGATSSRTVTADSTGKAIWNYKIGPKGLTGTYSFMARATYNSQTATSNTAAFTVQ